MTGSAYRGVLNRYTLIFKRLIFESRVRAGKPNLVASALWGDSSRFRFHHNQNVIALGLRNPPWLLAPSFVAYLLGDSGEAERAFRRETERRSGIQKQEWEVATRELFLPIASRSFPRSSICTSGRSCRTSRARWSPTVFAKIFSTRSMVPGYSGISRTLFGGAPSNRRGWIGRGHRR
jgi:hypothetical protein